MATLRTEMAVPTHAPLKPDSLAQVAPLLLLISATLSPLSLFFPPQSMTLMSSMSSSLTMSTSQVPLSHS